MHELAARLRSYWSELQVALAPGTTTAEMDAFELGYQVKLPTALREFLPAVNGFAEGEWDDELVEWYPLTRWRPMTDLRLLPVGEPKRGAAFVFADYSLDGFLYYVHLGPERLNDCPVFVYGGNEPLTFAASWSELIETYLHDPACLLRF